MKQEELEKKVELYLERAKQDPFVEEHPVNRQMYWRIIGGARGDYGDREPMKEILHGNFIDAIAYAVQQPEFYSDQCPPYDTSNVKHGKVEKIPLRRLEDYGIVETVKSSE